MLPGETTEILTIREAQCITQRCPTKLETADPTATTFRLCVSEYKTDTCPLCLMRSFARCCLLPL